MALYAVVYCKENPTKVVSLSKFAALRPRNVRKLANNPREYCCCVYCVNIRYKLLSLNRALSTQSKKKSCEKDLCQILLCAKPDSQRFHNRDCIEGRCKSCCNYTKTLQEYYGEVPNQKLITWSRWEKQKVMDKDKKVLVSKTGTKAELLEEMIRDVKSPVQGTSFMEHLHTAHWQAMQYDTIQTNLPEGAVLQVMDFAKNRGIKYQNEIKAAFYTAGQVTLHPFVSYYRSEGDFDIVRESDIIISEDCEHDYHAVEHFQEVVHSHLVKQMGHEPSQKIIFSDGCSCQYKSKGPFSDLAFSKSKICRNYFGSEHGKGPSDAETGVINRAIDRAIVGNKVVINNAEELFDFCGPERCKWV